MGDYTNATLIIEACPPDKREAVLNVIRRQGLGEDWGTSHVGDTLQIGEQYVDDSASLAANIEVADDLIEAAPDAAFVIWTDPKYEYLGGITMYTPELGRFDGDCDADGNVVIQTPAARQQLQTVRDVVAAERVDLSNLPLNPEHPDLSALIQKGCQMVLDRYQERILRVIDVQIAANDSNLGQPWEDALAGLRQKQEVPA